MADEENHDQKKASTTEDELKQDQNEENQENKANGDDQKQSDGIETEALPNVAQESQDQAPENATTEAQPPSTQEQAADVQDEPVKAELPEAEGDQAQNENTTTAADDQATTEAPAEDQAQTEQPGENEPTIENLPENTAENTAENPTQEPERTTNGTNTEPVVTESIDANGDNAEIATDNPPHPTTPATTNKPDEKDQMEGSVETEQDKTLEDSAMIPQEIPSATVKFVLLPTAQVATMKCALNQTLKELKDHFARELKIPAGVILLLHEGSNMEDEKTLADLGVGPNGTVQLDMQSADPVNTPIKAFKPRQEYVMPDVITVRVETEPQRYKDIVVEVERSTFKKPFLGGFRHKQTGVEYHNASAQTSQKPRPPSNVERYCRDTQTYNMKHMRQQTSEDTATQMTKIGVYVSNMDDKLIVPGRYTTAEQHHKMILSKIIILQKYWRRWLAQKFVNRIKDDMQKRVDWEKQEELKKRQEKELRIKREFDRRMNPKSKEDFDLLYAALEKWRLEELEKIDRNLTGAERKAALCQLLDQETQLIASIGRHKFDANIENRQKTIQAFLDKAAAPKKWKGPDGCYTAMDTPYTIRAQELKDIYNSICMKYLTQDERLDVLLTLKHTVKEHDCKLTQEIIELIDREADLLMRGVRDSNLEGLRKRISTLFLQYIKTPTFNPEAARLLKVPQDPSQLRQNIYYCASCNQYLPSVEFQLSTNSRTVGRCRKCRNLDNDGRIRQDYSHYRLMLRDLRRVEESYGDDSKVAFLLQENDLRYLVEKIWNSQSIISAWDDLYDLILVRWDKHKEWSPWNCVLITKEESSAHERLESLDEGYGKELIHKVHRKHALARNYFSRLPGMSEYMRKRVTEPAQGPSVEGISVN